MDESKEAVLQQWEEAKAHIDRIQKEINENDDARWNCLCRLKEAYDKKDTQLIYELEKELKTHMVIFQENRTRRNEAEENVFHLHQPALLKVSQFIDVQCGYPPRETL
jgi:hypothetical protein